MKKGYFFTLDASIAVVLLIIGSVILIGYMIFTPDKEKTEGLSNDVINFMADVKLSDMCTQNPCQCNYATLTALCPDIKNPDISLLEFMAQMYYDGVDNKRISSMIKEMFIDTGVVPENFNLQITLYDTGDPLIKENQLYPETP